MPPKHGALPALRAERAGAAKRRRRRQSTSRTPATGVNSDVRGGRPKDVVAAVEAARPRGRPGATSAPKTGNNPTNAARAARACPSCEIETRQTGRPGGSTKHKFARGAANGSSIHASLAETTEGAGAELHRRPGPLVRRREGPAGVCAFITPGNHPLLIASKKLAPCLATGNVAVVKDRARAGLRPAARRDPRGEWRAARGGQRAPRRRRRGRALAAHEDVARVDLTGGTKPGKRSARSPGRGRVVRRGTRGPPPLSKFLTTSTWTKRWPALVLPRSWPG